ncbi:MAG: diguanylate cyclase [Oribacterium sp.]|nr:diguanylate cyclase [Oribacterium sp.]
MKTILVVDDDIVSLTTAKNVLGADYKVIIVKSGAQALTYVGKNSCDLILLDINMPEMDGFEAFGKIREVESAAQVPIIFLTSDNDARTETKCFETGAIDFISKPFVPSVIKSRVARVLELEDLRKSLADRLEKKTQEVSDIKTKSRQDALTGLWNRAYTEEQVNSIISSGGTGSLLMIDMDNFKAINDNYGHIAGDQTLKMFADTMRAHSKESDVLCRIGGDEFVAFIEGCVSKSEIANLASDIIADLCRKIEEKNYNTNTSVSIGIAMTGTDGNEFTKLYNCADKALYYVKQNGKNSFHFFSDQSDAERERGSTKVDLKYLSEMLSRADGGTGAYMLDFDSFHHVYNFIRRFVGRSGSSVQTLLFTAVSTTPDELEDAETEIALEMLDKAIYSSLRRVDVSTRYSSRQMIVILMDASTEDSSIVADRIIDAFEKLYIGGKVRFKYDIADMSKDMKLVQREQGSEEA